METEGEMNRRFVSQLPGNLISNILYFLFSVAVSILLVPYFLSTLGVAAYGLIPLAGALTGYVAIVVQSLNITISRYLTVDLQRSDFAAANRTFNTAFFSLAIIIAVMMPVVIIFSWAVPVIFNVPAGQETGAIVLVLCASLAFFISSLTGTYTVQLYAYNRLDLTNLVNTVSTLVQVGLIVLLFSLLGPSLIIIGVAYLGAAMSSSIIAIILAKKVCPHLRLSPSLFDRSRVRDLWEMGGWVMISQVGALLFLQIDLIVVNIIFGAVSAGEYAIVLKAGTVLRTVAGVLGGVLGPIILTYYAREHTVKLIQVSQSAVKLMGLAMALPIGLICGFAPQILALWVGEQYVFLAPLMIFLTLHLTVNLSILPLISIRIAYNRVRIPGLVSLFSGLGNLALAVILSLYSTLGYYAVAAAGAIVLTLTNAVFTPWYTARILKMHMYEIVKSILPGLLATFAVIASALVFSNIVDTQKILMLFAGMAIIGCGYSIVVLRYGLNTFEHRLFRSYLPGKLRKFF